MDKHITKGTIRLVAILAALLLTVAVVVNIVLHKGKPSGSASSDEAASDVNVVGTWYSNRPDCVTFTEGGDYSFAAWNGGNPWLSFAGTYRVAGGTVTLQNNLDGSNVLTIHKDSAGNITLTDASETYTYYQTEEAAKEHIAAASEQAASSAANVVPNTTNKLMGEWLSWDGYATCVFTDHTITVHRAAYEGISEATIQYTYEILSDSAITIQEEGKGKIKARYKITENKDGSLTLWCDGISYGPTFNKAAADTAAADSNASSVAASEDAISAVEPPDASEYSAELTTRAQNVLIGTWTGTFDEWTSADTVYWRYNFNEDGTYTFTNGTDSEAGTYTLTCDPNNSTYSLALHFTFEGGERTMQFRIATNRDPIQMITEYSDDPTYCKGEEG